MILAAGAGTRARHLTDYTRNRFAMAKPRFPILETPIIEHWFRAAKQIGIKEIMANLWSNPETIESYAENFRSDDLKIKFFMEESLKGTMGSAISWPVKEGINDSDTLIVLGGDILCNASLEKILSSHEKSGADLSVVFNPVPWSQVVKYGTASFEGFPEKRPQGENEPVKAYEEYLDTYKKKVDTFIDANPYQSLKVSGFKEKVPMRDCLSNCNNSSIYIMSGKLVNHLFPKLTRLEDKLAPRFNDFGRDGFPYLLEPAQRDKFQFNGIILPRDVYWMDVGDPGKLWLSLLDTLWGHFDRSSFGLIPESNKPIVHVDQTAYVHPDAELIPPYYIGPNAYVGANAHVGPCAIVSSYGRVESNSIMVGGFMLETAHYHEGDQVRELKGSHGRGASLERSILASGSIPSGIVGQNNTIFLRPDGLLRFAWIGMSKRLSEMALGGQRVEAVEELPLT